METETDVNEILYVWSSVKKEITRVSSLYPDGRLYVLEDPMQWILNNPTSLQLVRNLELNLGIFDVEKLGKSLEQLPELSQLYLWSDVKYLPNTILSLQKLEYLEVRGFILLELPQNLGKLKSLKHLYICDSQCLKFLPDSITKLQNLVTLDLSYCRSLTKLPVNLGQLANLRHLSLLGCPLTSLPDSMAKLCSLESLDLSGCCAVKDYPRFLGRLFNLKSLSLCFCCFNSYNMPNPSKLESLHLCGKCDCITELPSCLDVGIKHLSFHDIGDIEFLPDSISNLSSLESLVLKGKFSDDPLTLPMNFDVLVSLKSLSLESYDKITSLPESLTKLSKLVSLKLDRYFELKDLPPNMDQLVGLRHLSLIGFCRIESFPDSLTKLSNLETLHLYGLSDCNIPLVELPAGFGQLMGLKHISIGYCDIWSLPDSITNLSNLETLILKGCDNLTALPVSMGQLVNLRCLSLESCPIESFPDVAGLHNLESLELTCYSLRKLPEDLGELVKLVRLNISGSEIKCLPSSISKLHNLQSLILSDCFRLETLLPLNLNDSVVIIAIGCTKIRETTWGELKKEITPFSEQMVAEATTGESGLGFMNEQAIPDEPLKVFDAASFPKACRSTLNHKIRDFGIKGKSIRKREHHKRNRKHSNVTPSLSSVRLNLIDPGLNWQSTRKRKRKERCNANRKRNSESLCIDDQP